MEVEKVGIYFLIFYYTKIYSLSFFINKDKKLFQILLNLTYFLNFEKIDEEITQFF